MSRLTLIFTQMSLAGDGAKDHIRSNILKTMDGAHDAKKSRHVEAMWRLFFREYLRAVSGIVPQIYLLHRWSIPSSILSRRTSPSRRSSSREPASPRTTENTRSSSTSRHSHVCGADMVELPSRRGQRTVPKEPADTHTDFPIDLMNAEVDPNLVAKHATAITRFRTHLHPRCPRCWHPTQRRGSHVWRHSTECYDRATRCWSSSHVPSGDSRREIHESGVIPTIWPGATSGTSTTPDSATVTTYRGNNATPYEDVIRPRFR